MTNNNDNSTEEAIREAISDSVKSSQGVQHSPMPSPERTGIKRPKSASEIIRCASDDVFSLQTKVVGLMEMPIQLGPREMFQFSSSSSSTP